jgi:hypothetical protein
MNGHNLDDYLFGPSWRWRKWIWGIPADIWIKNAGISERLIKAGQATRIDPQSLPPIGDIAGGITPVAREAEKSKAPAILKIQFPGGIRFAHLHYKGDVYQVSPEGWKEFTQVVMDGMMQKLKAAKGVSFEQVMEVSSSIDALG